MKAYGHLFHRKTILLTLSSIYISRRTRIAGSACSVDWTLHRERQYFVFRAGCQLKASLLSRSVTFLIGNESHAPTSVQRAPGVTSCDVCVASIRAPIVNQLRNLDCVPRPPFAVVISSSWRLVFRISARTVVSSRECHCASD